MIETVHHSRAAALCLAAVPVVWLASELVSPGHAGSADGELNLADAHPERWTAAMALVAIGSMLLVAALPALLRLTRTRGARLALVGTVLLGYSNIVAASDAINEIGLRSMVDPAADRGQMVALIDRVEAGAGAPFFVTGGISFMVGAVLLAVALGRSHAVPAWSAAVLGASFVVNLLGWAGASHAVVLASTAAMIVGVAPAAAALGGGVAPRRTAAAPAVA